MSLTYLKILIPSFILLVNTISIIITVNTYKHLKKLNWRREHNEIITRKLLEDIEKWSCHIDVWIFLTVCTLITSIPSGLIAYFTLKRFI